VNGNQLDRVTTTAGKRKKKDVQASSLWSYALPMLLSAAVGAGLTLLITSQRSDHESRPVVSATAVPASAAMPDVSGLSSADAAVARGDDAYDHERWPEAIREYRRAIASGGDTPDVRTDLGNAFRFSGEAGKALEQYKIARKMDPQHENSLFNEIGLFNEVLHDHADAVPLCEEFMRRFPMSDKLPAVEEQLARAKNPGASASPSDAAASKALSKWLVKQPKEKP
jgi:tetratricopeptide (TPR) repeat protein